MGLFSKKNQAPDEGGPDKHTIKVGGQDRVIESTSTSPGNNVQRDNDK